MKYNYFKTLFYVFSFLPLVLHSVSANILYIFMYLFKKIDFNKKYGIIFPISVIYFPIGFFISFVYWLSFDIQVQQLSNFVFFYSGLLLVFLDIKADKQYFVNSIIIATMLYSILLFYSLYESGLGLSNGLLLKKVLRNYITDWPQRYSVLIIFGFILSFSKFIKKKSIMYAICASILCMAIVITFSRAIWAGAIIGYFFYMVCEYKKTTFKLLIKSLLFIAIILFIFVLANYFDVSFYNYFNTNQYLSIIDRTYAAILNINNPQVGSDADRIAIWKVSFDILMQSPIFGTGFAGIGNFTNIEGSTHSQYVDIILRTGLIGFFLYISLWLRLLKYYWFNNPPIFGGFIGIFIVGFAHESTKLSYIALLFFVFLNFTYKDNNE